MYAHARLEASKQQSQGAVPGHCTVIRRFTGEAERVCPKTWTSVTPAEEKSLRCKQTPKNSVVLPVKSHVAHTTVYYVARHNPTESLAEDPLERGNKCPTAAAPSRGSELFCLLGS